MINVYSRGLVLRINLLTGKPERLQSLYLQMPSMSGGFQAKRDAGESSGEAASRSRAGIRTRIKLTDSATNQRLLLPILRQGFENKIPTRVCKK